MKKQIPSVFVSHGAPTLYLEPGPTHYFLSGLGQILPKPDAILCVSAHWTTRKPMVTFSPAPETIHDFYGFPEELYRVRYPAPGAPDLAGRALELLGEAGIEAGGDHSRGLDHGAWVPLGLMYPQADIPVAQLSVQPGTSASGHLALGKALAPLAAEGVLILGSGGATHNLADVRWDADGLPPAGYAAAFDSWLKKAVLEGREADLAGYLANGPEATRNHPTPEHFLPLFAPMGAGGAASLMHDAFSLGVLSMAAFRWDNRS